MSVPRGGRLRHAHLHITDGFKKSKWHWAPSPATIANTATTQKASLILWLLCLFGSFAVNAGEGAQCLLLFCAEGATGAIAWGETPQRGAQPQD